MTDSELGFRIEIDRADTADADAAAAELADELERHGFALPSQESIEGIGGLGAILVTFGIPLLQAATPIIVEWIRGWMSRNDVDKAVVTLPDGTKLAMRGGSVEQFEQLLAAARQHGAADAADGAGGDQHPRSAG
ncbi:MAG: hypothetical protein ACKVWR_07640 [Acidimicrobiales bacterium]